MQILVIVSVVLGVAFATPFLPRDPNVAAARARFIQEYNRLAALAAAAPDDNIIMDDRTRSSVVNNHRQQQQPSPQQVHLVRQQKQPPQPAADVAGARARFIQEYNRLAALAAAAPDVNIIMNDRTHSRVVNKLHKQKQPSPRQVPFVRQQQQPPHPPADVAGARARFIQEYNRLAALAAAAPDVHIIMDDRTHPSIVNNHHQQQQHNPRLVPLVHQQQQPQTLSQRQPPNPAFNQLFTFGTNLGDNQQFIPQSNFIQPVATTAPRKQHNNAQHTISQLANLPIAGGSKTIFSKPTRWTGPFADTLPAGVNGLPRQVADTPEVAAAKQAHFRAHALAHANNPTL